MKLFAPVVVLSLVAATTAHAQQTPPPPPVYEPPPPPPSSSPPERRRDSAVDLHLDTGWNVRHFDTLTVKAPDFGLGIGYRTPDAGCFAVLRYTPGSTSERLEVRTYGLDVDFQAIWGHFRMEFGIGFAFVGVDRVTRDNTIVGSFVNFNLGPRVDLLQLEPVTVFLRAQGTIGGGDGFYAGALLGGGIEFDLYKLH